MRRAAAAQSGPWARPTAATAAYGIASARGSHCNATFTARRPPPAESGRHEVPQTSTPARSPRRSPAVSPRPESGHHRRVWRGGSPSRSSPLRVSRSARARGPLANSAAEWTRLAFPRRPGDPAAPPAPTPACRPSERSAAASPQIGITGPRTAIDGSRGRDETLRADRPAVAEQHARTAQPAHRLAQCWTRIGKIASGRCVRQPIQGTEKRRVVSRRVPTDVQPVSSSSSSLASGTGSTNSRARNDRQRPRAYVRPARCSPRQRIPAADTSSWCRPAGIPFRSAHREAC